MTSELAQLTALLQAGQRESMQGSYKRRAPEKKALPALRSARAGLRDLVTREPSPEAWRALALAEEALLHYPAALQALERAIALSPNPERKDLKRLAALREYAPAWKALGITAEVLEDLGEHLEEQLEAEPCDHTLRHTKSWLTARGFRSVAKTLRAIQEAGGGCDCEVVMNVV